MRSVGEAYQPAAEDSHHKLDIQVEDGVSMTGDRQLLAQMVSNLVENALHHTPEGTTVSLVLRKTGTGFEVEVADNGPGVPETEHDKVFDRFYRLDRSRSTAGSGLRPGAGEGDRRAPRARGSGSRTPSPGCVSC